MKTAPRDGTLIRLWLREGGDFVGRYSDKFWGWIRFDDLWPWIRHDTTFAGWEPIDEAERRRVRQQWLGPTEVPKTTTEIQPAKVMSAIVRPAKVATRIVTARKPRPRR